MTLIERLRGWLVADYIEAYTTGSTLIREAADEIERLTAENAALRADAERYRWLRSAKTGKPVVCTTADSAWNAWLNTVELDNAIDAARSKT